MATIPNCFELFRPRADVLSTLSPLGLNLLDRNLPCFYLPSSIFITSVVCWLNFFFQPFFFYIYLHNHI